MDPRTVHGYSMVVRKCRHWCDWSLLCNYPPNHNTYRKYARNTTYRMCFRAPVSIQPVTLQMDGEKLYYYPILMKIIIC
jgi:hypothetical protein